MRPDVASTLVELLEHRRDVDADRTAFCFLPDGSAESGRLSYAETFDRATAIGAALQELGATGERVLITYPGDRLEEYVTGFLGCVMAGAVAVPCDSPRSRGGVERLSWIAEDSRPNVVLGPTGDSRGRGSMVGAARFLDVADVPDSASGDWRRPDLTATSLALLQYTSGSTRSPRGVRVMHRNVLANERAIATACEHDQDSHFVGWLPLFHDMGLIADVLQPLYLGATSVLMPPAAFLADPMRWLTAIGRYRGVGGGGPNFAFELCVSRVPEARRNELDLTTWRTAFNGAEVVRRATIERFTAAFGPAGFAPESFFSCYGLAEATLIVAGAPRRRAPVVVAADVEAERRGRLRTAAGFSSARSVVSSGRVVVDTEIAIVHGDSGTRLPSGSIGEVWVRGPGVADGYWGTNSPSDSFSGLITGDTGGPFLRTGDLGAMVDDELYLVGRVKDLIIVRGANHHPGDIEWTVENCSREVRPSCVAVFSAPDGGIDDERVVVVCEPGSDESVSLVSEIASGIRAAVARRHGLAVYDVVLAARGTVTKTTSGKVRRSAVRAAYGEGSVVILGRSREDTASARDVGSIPEPVELLAMSDAAAVNVLVAGILASAGVELGDAPLPDSSVSMLGLDSLRAVELQHRVQARLGVNLPPFTFVGDRMLKDICVDLLRRLRAGVEPAAPRPPLGTEGPASLIQTAIVLDQETAPPGPAYVLTRALRIRGDVDVAALRRALGRVVERHPALSATLRLEGGEVRQVQSSAGPVLTERALDGDLWAALAVEAGRPLPVQLHLVRFTLLRRSADEIVLVLAAHHAVVDFWSAVLVVRELFALYEEEVGGPVADLAAPGIGPVEQAMGQHALSSGAEGDALRAYWARRLTGAPPVTALPRSRPRPAVRMFHGATARKQVDRAVVTGLRALADRSECTLFTVLLAALQVLVARTAGQPDVVIGTSAAQRGHADLGNSVGCLTNLLPVRVVVDLNEDVRTLLRRVHALLGDDLARSNLPFSEIVRAAAPERDPSRPTLVQTAIVLQREPGRPDDSLRALALGVDGPLADGPVGLDVDVVEVAQQWAHLDVTLQVAAIDGALSVVAEYDVAAFEPREMDDVLDLWRTLLEGFVDRPDQPVGRLPMLSETAHAWAVAQGSGAAVVAEPLSLPALVERRWAAAPDHIAVVVDGDCSRPPEHLSAAAGQRWADELGRRLAAAGVSTGSRVGILLDRSVGLPIAMLAVMRLGAAYVPLEPSDPHDRISWTAGDARITAVITDRLGDDSLLPGIPRVALAPPHPASSQRRTSVPGTGSDPELAAYVMYTSGSTGRQKGVVVPHRAIVNRLRWMQRAIPLAVGDRVLHRTPITFDVSLWELFWPLIEGATLVVAPPGSHREPDRLADVARRQQIGIMHAVPTALGHLLPHLDEPGTPLALRRMICSGETLPSTLRDRFLRTINAELFNLYGPTEAAVDVTWWHCRPGQVGPVPIGMPIDATDIHVVDQEGMPTPSGVEGQLVIGGAPLAHGYAGRPGLTARSWRPHPFGSRPGERVYLTGDRAVRRADGAVLFLGRLDHQVSLSGRRVELGEIEDAFRELPGVADAVVTLEDGIGGPRLIGHVVLEDSPSVRDVSASELAGRLRRRLPAALIPSVIQPIPTLPITANGKLDRRRLARLGGTAADDTAVAAEPMPPLQEQIALAWSEVLGCPTPGSDDDFFAVGGDSITALRVVAALQRIGIDVRVAELLANPTVRSLAGALLSWGTVSPPTPTFTVVPFALCPPEVRDRLPADAVDAYPVSSAQLAVLFQQLRAHQHEVYVTSLRLRGPFDHERMLDSVRALSARHPYLRSRLELTLYREPLQVVFGPLEMPLQVVDLRGRPESACDEVVSSWCQAERTRPFDVEHGPLARVTVHVRDGLNWHITLSSFALDGWATATVLTEVLAHHGGAQVIDPPRSDYRTFVALERAAVSDPDHRRFWSEELAGAPVSTLPRRSAGPLERTTRRIEIPMDGPTAESITRMARRLGLAERTLLLAAHLRVVRAITGARDVVTGVEWSGRPEEPDGDRVVGVFNNILPLRVTVDGTWTDLIHATATAERRAAPFRRYPLAQVERDLGRPGLVTTMFVHTHFHLYRDLGERAGVEVLGSWAPDRTYVPLTAHTNVDASTGRIRLLLDVDPEEVDERTVELASALYPAAWHAMTGDPAASCIADDLLTAQERRRQLQLDEGATAPIGPASALRLIAEQAVRTPDRVALVDGDQQVTYRGLMDRASALGGALRDAGVRPDTVVAIPARRTAQAVTSMLAVWDAGAAYLPIDPDDPIDRIAHSLRAARVTHAVAPLAEQWTAAAGTVLDPGATARDGMGHRGTDPQMLAYVLPTSGSTGVPKLVAVPHGALVNYLQWCSDNYRVSARTPVHSPVGFDLTVTALLAPLVAGGTVELLPDRAGPEAVGSEIGEFDGIVKITPAHLAAVADQVAVTGGRVPADLMAVVGGEPLTGRHVYAWREAGGVGPIINEYGPTEATVGCIATAVPAGTPPHDVPVGRPLPGTRARVLDGPISVPDGVEGELAVGGRGLARGYLGSPSATASRFAPDPHGNGQRLYLTGDRARRDSAGQLHVHGRGDRQVKIRGRRVEPAAVEAVICAHPGVHAAAVTVFDVPGSQRRLVGYWVSDGADEPGARAMTAWLASRVAAHEVPDTMMWLPMLPLTPRGKVDRSALPDPRLGTEVALAALVSRLPDDTVAQLLAREETTTA